MLHINTNCWALSVTKLNEKNLEKVHAWRDQEDKNTQGCVFFSETDLGTNKALKMDTSGKAIITILRHIQRIKNARGAGPKRFILQNSS